MQLGWPGPHHLTPHPHPTPHHTTPHHTTSSSSLSSLSFSSPLHTYTHPARDPCGARTRKGPGQEMKPNGRPGAEPGARGPEMKPNGDEWCGGGGYLDRPENETVWGGRGGPRMKPYGGVGVRPGPRNATGMGAGNATGMARRPPTVMGLRVVGT